MVQLSIESETMPLTGVGFRGIFHGRLHTVKKENSMSIVKDKRADYYER